MRILQVHNRYRPGWGGEDTVADLEAELLREHGHEVDRLIVSTAELNGAGAIRLLQAAVGAVWSLRGYSALKKKLAAFPAEIVHVHNSFPLLSPSIFWAADRAGVPVVQTLHNFRLVCANSLLLRDNRPCLECVGKIPWRGLRHRCFGHSFWRTLPLFLTNIVHRALGTFSHKVHAHIALNAFSQQVLLQAGLPPDGIFIKPNFLSELTQIAGCRRDQFVYAGEIAAHKGVALLLAAWKHAGPSDSQLVLVGDGPDRAELEERYNGDPSIIWRGRQPHDAVLREIAESRFLVLASLCYENCPMAVVEALSKGTPVIVPNHGAFPSMISNQEEGIVFAVGDPMSLADALSIALHASPSDWNRWSSKAFLRFRNQFSAAQNYGELLKIYENAVNRFNSNRTQSHPA